MKNYRVVTIPIKEEVKKVVKSTLESKKKQNSKKKWKDNKKMEKLQKTIWSIAPFAKS